MTAPARVWSSSAVDSYVVCPAQWGERFGPNRATRSGTTDPADRHVDVYRRRGRVLHRALCTALRSAEVELADRTTPLAGATLHRYWRAARVELGKAWQEEGMPSDPDEAQLCIDLLQRSLQAVPVPRPGAIHGIEKTYEHTTTPDGTRIKFIPDWTWWVNRRAGVLRIVDWKSGKIEPDEVGRHQQLLRYAAWMAQLDPQITAVEIELFAMREGVGHVVAVDPAMAARAAARFERTVARAEADTELAPTPGPKCNGCYFKRTCPAVGGKVTVVDAA